MRETSRAAWRWVGALAAGGLALLMAHGCDIETLRIQVCSDGLGVLVSTEPGAEFDWSGGCGVGELEVREAGANERVVWRIRDRAAKNRLVAPIRYGSAPSEATVVVPPAPLEPGAGYLVEVRSLTALGAGSTRIVVGQAAFVR